MLEFVVFWIEAAQEQLNQGNLICYTFNTRSPLIACYRMYIKIESESLIAFGRCNCDSTVQESSRFFTRNSRKDCGGEFHNKRIDTPYNVFNWLQIPYLISFD